MYLPAGNNSILEDPPIAHEFHHLLRRDTDDHAFLESPPLDITAAHQDATPDYDYMFGTLQGDTTKQIPDTDKMREALIRLGMAMSEPHSGDPPVSTIPAIYTYFGQFISHDLTFDSTTATVLNIFDKDFKPLSQGEAPKVMKNLRSGQLDLDSLYEWPAAQDQGRMLLGKVEPEIEDAPTDQRPPFKDEWNDLLRSGPSSKREFDRTALIGDPRNDENLVLGQLHVAFLRAHNNLLTTGMQFDDAVISMRRHYHHLVLYDFLPKLVEQKMIDQEIAAVGGLGQTEGKYSLPLEFSAAAFRVGHTMVRSEYNYNLNSQPATLTDLFTFTALSGVLGPVKGANQLRDNWIIEWENFVGPAQSINYARRLDTNLVEPLFRLRDEEGRVGPGPKKSLAVRNLLRGYQVGLPTGQAIADLLGVDTLGPQQLRDQAGSKEHRDALIDGGFDLNTPLWYYILAEAFIMGEGNRLGPVGGTIVSRTLVNLLKRSPDSILNTEEPWKPALGRNGTFTIADLLRLSGNLPGIVLPADEHPT